MTMLMCLGFSYKWNTHGVNCLSYYASNKLIPRSLFYLSTCAKSNSKRERERELRINGVFVEISETMRVI